MLKKLWTLARLDLVLWSRMPLAIETALIPPLGMALLLVVLTFSVGKQPVALVVLSHGENAQYMEHIIKSDDDAYALSITDAQNAKRLLKNQEVAAIITIPSDFDEKVKNGKGIVDLVLNNVDIDFADDIRRAVDRSIAEFDAPQLGLEGEEDDSNQHITQPNPYRIGIVEKNLRKTTVDFLSYQVLPALVLLVLSVGLIGTALLCAYDVERGTARYRTLAPIESWLLVSGRLLGGVLASLAVLMPVLFMCYCLRIIAPPLDHVPALVALFIATAICASGIGATLGSLMRGARNVAMASSIIATYLFFLGGGFTTIAFLPPWLRNISIFVPIRYAIDGIRQALFYPNLDGVTTDLLVLVATAVIATIIGSFAVRHSWSS